MIKHQTPYSFDSEIRDKVGNEDSAWAGYMTLHDGTSAALACVADGVSGGRNGREVADMAIAAVREAVRHAYLTDFLGMAQVQVWAAAWGSRLQAQVRQLYPEGYSTLCAVVLLTDKMVIIHVGDSLAYWISPSDREYPARLLTEPHTVAAAWLDVDNQARKSEESVAPQFHKMLNRAVGKKEEDGLPLLDARVMPCPNVPSWIVIGSDGVFDQDIGGTDLRRLAEQADGDAGLLGKMVLDASRINGRRKGVMMDNASIAVLGIQQPRRKKKWGKIVLANWVPLCVVLLSIAFIGLISMLVAVGGGQDERTLNVEPQEPLVQPTAQTHQKVTSIYLTDDQTEKIRKAIETRSDKEAIEEKLGLSMSELENETMQIDGKPLWGWIKDTLESTIDSGINPHTKPPAPISDVSGQHPETDGADVSDKQNIANSPPN